MKPGKRLLRGMVAGSPPVRGAWIETSQAGVATTRSIVAPRAGGVD